jgi:hypothetical protein
MLLANLGIYFLALPLADLITPNAIIVSHNTSSLRKRKRQHSLPQQTLLLVGMDGLRNGMESLVGSIRLNYNSRPAVRSSPVAIGAN